MSKFRQTASISQLNLLFSRFLVKINQLYLHEIFLSPICPDYNCFYLNLHQAFFLSLPSIIPYFKYFSVLLLLFSMLHLLGPCEKLTYFDISLYQERSFRVYFVRLYFIELFDCLLYSFPSFTFVLCPIFFR